MSGLTLIVIGCGGGGSGSPTPPHASSSTHSQDDAFILNGAAPHANPFPYDAQDVAQTIVSPKGHRDGAGVFVYANQGPKTYVLLARRAPWLSASGKWGVFGGSVETTDLDSAGHMSYARAAEHERYEESATVYHQTDAIALRNRRTHLKQWRSGLKFRTFFSKQPYFPEARFNQGYAYAI
jgi:hypothetical protein